jgi:hypothetical protein
MDPVRSRGVTLLLPELRTKASLLSEVITISLGLDPTVTFASGSKVFRSIGVMLELPELATKANLPSEVWAIKIGVDPTGIEGSITGLVPLKSIGVTALSFPFATSAICAGKVLK